MRAKKPVKKPVKKRRLALLSSAFAALTVVLLIYQTWTKLETLANDEVRQTNKPRSEGAVEPESERGRTERIGEEQASQGRAGISKDPWNSEESAEQTARGSDSSLEYLRQEWSELPIPSVLGAYSGRQVKLRDLFLHQGNYKRLLRHYVKAGENDTATLDGDGEGPPVTDVDDLIKNKRSFPDSSLKFLSGYDFSSCCAVGNSGVLLNSTFGRSIDSHEVVLRFNQAPRGDSENKLERQVGTKTTFRLINTRWTKKYRDASILTLPLETSVTLVVTRTHPSVYEAIAEMLKKKRPDVKLLYLSGKVIRLTRGLLVEYRRELERKGFRGIPGGNTPSSGLVGVYFLLQACEKVTVFGFGLDDIAGGAQEYHYFRVKKKSSIMNPTHSFDTEKILLRSLAAEGKLTFCGGRPGDRRDCGLQHEARRNQRAADRLELSGVE